MAVKIRREGYRNVGFFTSFTVSDDERKKAESCFTPMKDINTKMFSICGLRGVRKQSNTNVTNCKWMCGRGCVHNNVYV